MIAKNGIGGGNRKSARTRGRTKKRRENLLMKILFLKKKLENTIEIIVGVVIREKC
jgi:hypothetical protein